MGQLANGAFDGLGTGVFTGAGQSRWVHAEYDFARHGGAQSSIVLAAFPAGTQVLGGYMNVETAAGISECGRLAVSHNWSTPVCAMLLKSA